MTQCCRLIRLLAGLWLAGLVPARSQSRFEDLKGFTRASPESIIVEIEAPMLVQRVEGVIVDAGSNPMANALIEIRGPGLSMRVKGVRTDQDGRFRMKHVAKGIYKFKVTSSGFQSVVGTLSLLKTGGTIPIQITLPFGI